MLSCCCVQVADGERRSSWGKRVEAAWRSTPKALLFSVSLCPNSAVSGQGNKYLRYPETLKYFKSNTNMTQNIMFSDHQSSTLCLCLNKWWPFRSSAGGSSSPRAWDPPGIAAAWCVDARETATIADSCRPGAAGAVWWWLLGNFWSVIWRFWMDLYLLFLGFSWLLLFVCGDFKVLDGLDGDLKLYKGVRLVISSRITRCIFNNINKWEYQPANRGQEKRTFPVSSKEGYRNGTRLVGTWTWDSVPFRVLTIDLMGFLIDKTSV